MAEIDWTLADSMALEALTLKLRQAASALEMDGRIREGRALVIHDRTHQLDLDAHDITMRTEIMGDSMKVRKLNANVVIKVPHLNLGNNYTMAHYVNELIACGHDDIIYHFDLDDNVRIVAQGNCGKATLNTCGNDLMDHLRG